MRLNSMIMDTVYIYAVLFWKLLFSTREAIIIDDSGMDWYCVQGEKTIETLSNYILTKLEMYEYSKDIIHDILHDVKKTISLFKSDFEKYWKQWCVEKDRFLWKYSNCLNVKLKFSIKVQKLINLLSTTRDSATSNARLGRPRKSFREGGIKTKKRLAI